MLDIDMCELFTSSNLGTLFSALAIFVALYVSSKSSKDVRKLIKENRKDTKSQIETMLNVSHDEMREVRVLSHCFIAGILFHLSNQNCETQDERNQIVSELNMLIKQFDEVKNWDLSPNGIRDVELCAKQKRTFLEIENQMLAIIEKCKVLSSRENSISGAFDMLHPALDAYLHKQSV